jgi:hypothetical protein
MNVASNGYVLGHSPPWPPETARGISAERKWQALLAQTFSASPTSGVYAGSPVARHRLVALVDARELTDAQKWQDICAELKLPPWEARNVGDVMYSLVTGWCPDMARAMGGIP